MLINRIQLFHLLFIFINSFSIFKLKFISINSHLFLLFDNQPLTFSFLFDLYLYFIIPIINNVEYNDHFQMLQCILLASFMHKRLKNIFILPKISRELWWLETIIQAWSFSKCSAPLRIHLNPIKFEINLQKSDAILKWTRLEKLIKIFCQLTEDFSHPPDENKILVWVSMNLL